MVNLMPFPFAVLPGKSSQKAVGGTSRLGISNGCLMAPWPAHSLGSFIPAVIVCSICLLQSHKGKYKNKILPFIFVCID